MSFYSAGKMLWFEAFLKIFDQVVFETTIYLRSKNRNIEYNKFRPKTQFWQIDLLWPWKTAYQMFSKWPQFFVAPYASIVSWTFILIFCAKSSTIAYDFLVYAIAYIYVYLIFLMYFCPFRPSSSKQRTIILHIQHSMYCTILSRIGIILYIVVPKSIFIV